jgi:CDP-diacylglycerol--serine O-phosphatidyltransferase
MFLWVLHDYARFGWIATLVFVICAALRLARFNTMLEDRDAPAWTKGYFTGIPTPAGAGLMLMPLVFCLEFGMEMKLPSPIVALWGIIIGGLMVSQVPTLALKGWRVPRFWVVPLFVALAILIATLVTNTWLALFALGMTYVISLPISWVSYRRRAKREAIDG